VPSRFRSPARRSAPSRARRRERRVLPLERAVPLLQQRQDADLVNRDRLRPAELRIVEFPQNVRDLLGERVDVAAECGDRGVLLLDNSRQLHLVRLRVNYF
jgi:hypothetical protein